MHFSSKTKSQKNRMVYKYNFGVRLPRLVLGANTAAAGAGSRMDGCVGTFLTPAARQAGLSCQEQAEPPGDSGPDGPDVEPGSQGPGRGVRGRPHHPCASPSLSFQRGKKSISSTCIFQHLFYNLILPFLPMQFFFASDEKKDTGNLRTKNIFLDRVVWKNERGHFHSCALLGWSVYEKKKALMALCSSLVWFYSPLLFKLKQFNIVSGKISYTVVFLPSTVQYLKHQFPE